MTDTGPAPVAGVDRGTDAAPPASTAVASDASGATRAHWVLFFALAIVIVVADQIVKAWIVANYDIGAATQIIGDTARIWISHNTGALFGLFRDQAPIFALFSIGVIAIIVWFEGHAGGNFVITLALGLLLGGAIGNFTDRVRLGYVVDFMDLGIGTWRFYTFNLADAAISASILLLVAVAVIPGLSRPPRTDAA